MSTWCSIWGEDFGVFDWHPDNLVFIDVARDMALGDRPVRLSLDEGVQTKRRYNTAYLSIAEAKELRDRLDKAIEAVGRTKVFGQRELIVPNSFQLPRG